MRRTPLPSAGDLFLAEASGEHVVGKVLWCSPVREHSGAACSLGCSPTRRRS